MNGPTLAKIILGTIFGIGCLVTIIVCLTLNWKVCDETSYCIRYDRNTRVVSPETYEPGTYGIGPSQDFIKFPSTVQNLVFPSEKPLVCRSFDGVKVNVSATVEYQLRRAELRDLFQELGKGFDDVFYRVAAHSMCLTGARYNATTYVLDVPGEGNSAAIRGQMLLDLQVALAPYHTEVLRVNWELVRLPALFEVTFQALESTKIARSQAAITREREVQLAGNSHQEKMIELAGQRDVALIKLQEDIELARNRREVDVARAEKDAEVARFDARNRMTRAENAARLAAQTVVNRRNAQLVLANQNGLARLTQARAQRDVILQIAESAVREAVIERDSLLRSLGATNTQRRIAAETAREIAIAAELLLLTRTEAARESLLTNASAEQERELLRADSVLDVARRDATVSERQANATAYAIAQEAEAVAERIALLHATDLDYLASLAAQAGFNASQLLKFRLHEALAGFNRTNATLYVDYPKAPAVEEGAIMRAQVDAAAEATIQL